MYVWNGLLGQRLRARPCAAIKVNKQNFYVAHLTKKKSPQMAVWHLGETSMLAAAVGSWLLLDGFSFFILE
jgi:hypothetical protein